MEASVSELEQQAYLHMSNLFVRNDFLKRNMLTKRILEMVVLAKIDNKNIIETLEHKITRQTIFTFISDIVEMVELARQTEMFSKNFYT